jgi:hypothetical protein
MFQFTEQYCTFPIKFLSNVYFNFTYITSSIEKTASDWNPCGCRRRGRPKTTWRRTIEDEIRSTGRSWNEVKGIAGDQNAWKLFMDTLCSTSKKDLMMTMMMMMI